MCICVSAIELDIISVIHILFYHIRYLYSLSLNNEIKTKNYKIRIILTMKQITARTNYRSMNWTVIMILYQMFRTNLYSLSAWSCSIINISLISGYKRKCGVGEEGKGLIIILLTNNLPVAGVHSVLPYTWAFQVKLVWLRTSD